MATTRISPLSQLRITGLVQEGDVLVLTVANKHGHPYQIRLDRTAAGALWQDIGRKGRAAWPKSQQPAAA